MIPPDGHPEMPAVEERPGVVERAFQIARSGDVVSLAELHARLTAEDYAGSVRSLTGRSIAYQLSRMISEARPGRTFMAPQA